MPPGRALLGIALFLLVCLIAAPARAWVEVHVEGDDVRIAVDKSGQARIEHRIRFKIAGGPLRALDLRGVDDDARPEPAGSFVVNERDAKSAEPSSLASAVSASAELMPPESKPLPDGSPPPRTIRVRFDNERGLGRGAYVLFVRYGANLSRHIAAEGAFAKIAWTGLAWDDGFDSARVTFAFTPAPTPPRAGDDEPTADAPVAPLVLSTIRRGTDKDEIELLRPYAPRGEAIVWTVRADLHAFAATTPRSPPRPPPSPSTVAGGLGDPAHRAIVLGSAAAIFLFYVILVAWKSREVLVASRDAGTTPRPLVPLPAPLRAIGAGLALVGGLALELAFDRGTLGAALVALAIALAAHRTPLWPRTQRGPGRWLPVSEREAFRDPPRPRGVLDVSSRAGKALLFVLLAAGAAGVFFVSEISPYHATLIAFDFSAILAIFGTGRAAELPPDPALHPAPFLRDVAARVRKSMRGEELRVVGRIRIPDGAPDADELRLGIAPRSALAGFSGIEVGLVYARGAGAHAMFPEVIVRVVSGSPCDLALQRIARSGRSTRGRKPNERAILFAPRMPTARMTAGIAAGLVRAVTERAASAAPVPASKPAARSRESKKRAA